MRSLLLLAALLSASEPTLAQSRARPDPADPGAAAPPPSYQSTFSDYQPFRDEKVRSWKDVNKEVADNPGMGSMKHGPGMTMPGMDSKTGDAAKGKEKSAGHDMASMKGMPGMTMSAPDKPAGSAPQSITGIGRVQLVDKPNGKVKLTHEPIAAMGWPKMTLVFRLKERSLADQVKEGDRVGFTLEKSASGYVITGFQKSNSEPGPAVNVSKPAAHGKH